MLFGLFYRPPSSNAAYLSSIEDSVHLAIDNGIQEIIVTGDFNCNMLNAQLSVKIRDLCEQFSLEQVHVRIRNPASNDKPLLVHQVTSLWNTKLNYSSLVHDVQSVAISPL